MDEEHKPLAVTLPKAVCDQLAVPPDTPMQLTVKDNRIVIQPDLLNRAKQRRTDYLWPLGFSLVAAIGVLIYWWWQDFHSIPLAGNNSVASFIIGCSVVSGTLLFAGFFIRSRNDQNRFAKAIYWRNFPAVMGAFVIMLGLAVVGLFWLLGLLFPGATFDLVTALLIFWIFTLTTNVVMVEAALRLNARTLIALLSLVVVTGVVISMASNGTRRWWQYNLSFLGTDLASNAWQFNLTLVLSGLLLVALVDYLFVSLHWQYPKNWRFTVLRVLLTLVAVDVSMVGLFPNNAQFHILHDEVAGFLVTLITLLIVLIRWLLPGLSKGFLMGSYGIAVLLLILNFGFRLFRYPSLTAFEIQGFALAFGWLLMLFGRILALVQAGVRTWQVTLEEAAGDDQTGGNGRVITESDVNNSR